MENNNYDSNKYLIEIQKKREEQKIIDKALTKSERTIYTFIVMGLAFLYYVFFENSRAGVSVPIFFICFVWAFYYINKERINMKSHMGIFALGCVAVLCIGYILYCNRIMESVNRIAIPMLLTGAFIMFRYPDTAWGRFGFLRLILDRCIVTPIRYILKPFQIIAGTVNIKSAGIGETRKSILKGIIVGIPILLLVLILLSSADMMYGYYLSRMGSYIRVENAGRLLDAAFKILITFVLFFAYLYSFKYNMPARIEKKVKNYSFDSVMSITLLAPLVIVYAVFIAIQVFYLFGKEGLPNGFNYAEYARQGFFQLLAVTSINFLITSFILHSCRKSGKEPGTVLKALLSLMAIFTFFMLFSSYYKLVMYEQEFGFTYLRFYVHCFIIMLFLLMCIIGAGIWIGKMNLLKCCFICTITFYCMLSLISPDKFIARSNLQRYNDTGKIDAEYLECLSPDAAPYIRDFLEKNHDSQFNGLRSWLYEQERKAGEYKWYEMNLPLWKLLNER